MNLSEIRFYLSFLPAYFATMLFIAAILFCIPDKRRKHFWWRIIPCAIVYNILPFIIPGSYNAWYLTAGWFSFSYIIFVLALVGIIYLCFDIKPINAIYYVVAAYAIQNTAQHFYELIFRMVDTAGGNAEMYVRLIVGIFAYAAVYVLYYFFIIRKVRSALNDKAKKRIVVVSVLTVLVVYILDMWLRSHRYGNIGLDIYAIITNALLIAVQAGIFKESEREREQVIITELLRQESKQNRLSKQNVDIMNIKFHDLKHRIAAAKSGNDDIDEIERSVEIYDSFVKSGSEILDIVLTEKSLVCKKKKSISVL